MSTSRYGQENNLHHHCITDKDWYITYLLFYSFNPSTWGHSSMDIEHVKILYNIYKRQNYTVHEKEKTIKNFT